jgi:L-seryl-tRNA(Ser) seleniumtransferase
VCFSGDKLLGGPQAGILIGGRALVERVRQHPLMRALRVDKLTYAALEATLIEYLAGRATEAIPVVRMLTAAVDEIDLRATALARVMRASGWDAAVVDGFSTVGGGSAPGVELPTKLIALARNGESADRLDAWLRSRTPPIVGRIENGRVVLDLRTVPPDHDAVVADVTALTSP